MKQKRNKSRNQTKQNPTQSNKTKASTKKQGQTQKVALKLLSTTAKLSEEDMHQN